MASPTAQSQIPLSPLGCSHIPSSRALSHSPSSSSLPTALATASPTTSPDLYVTFRVLRIVNALRKRITKRLRNTKPKKVTKAKARRAFCQDLEREAYEEIDNYLGRKISHCDRKGVWKGINSRTSPIPVATEEASSVSDQDSRIHRLLQRLSQDVSSDGHAIEAIAKDNRLFLNRKAEVHINKLSLSELCESLVTVKDLLATLKRSDTCQGGVRTLAEGNEVVDCELDEVYIANLEHLLLCLRDQILRLLVAECIGLVHQHVLDCQKDQSRHGDDWFFEFPDARHPESTTWPWSLKPSLAVLWGVCWMFYGFTPRFDSFGNIVNFEGQVVVPRAAVEQYVTGRQREQRQRQDSLSPVNTRTGLVQWRGSNMMVQARPRPVFPGTTDFSALSQPPSGVSFSPLGTNNSSATSPIRQHPTREGPPDPHPQAAHAAHGLASTHTSSYSALALPPNIWSVPQDTAYSTFGWSNSSTYPGAGDSWPATSALPSQSGFVATSEPHLPPRSQDASTPVIKISTDSSTYPGLQQPQDQFYSTSASASSAGWQEDPYHNPYQTRFGPQAQQYGMAAVETMSSVHQHPPPMDADMHGSHEPQHDPALINQVGRKRSHSEMIQEQLAQETMAEVAHPQPYPALPPPPMDHHMDHHPESEHDHNGQDGEHEEGADEYSPRGSRSFKRGDPPVNAENKYVCDFSAECDGQTFDRKCEWSKHMDKHDRPYRCPHPQCAKLQGFTYSGGLLRHEREVHGKHGGPKAQLMCPHLECKRHGGKGFTRKENLNEHLRRVHDNKTSPSDQQDAQADAFKAELQQAIVAQSQAVTGATQDTELPMPARLPYAEPYQQQHVPEPAEMVKRRRIEEEPGKEGESEDLKQEIDRLRIESADKDMRLRKMETNEAQLELRIRQLEEHLQNFQPPQPVQQQQVVGHTDGRVLAGAD